MYFIKIKMAINEIKIILHSKNKVHERIRIYLKVQPNNFISQIFKF